MKDNVQNEQLNESSTLVAQSLNKFNQGLKDGSKFQRKTALETMKKQIGDSLAKKTDLLIYSDESIKYVFKTTLTILGDQIEKCREIACDILSEILENFKNWDNDMTTMIIMTVMQRIGGKDVKESSEEIRLQLYSIINRLVELKSENNRNIFEIHFQELTSILINSFNDSYPEVKKKGCQCTKLLANKLAGANFHMQSESYIKPIITNMTHQHSRVRKDIIDCLCDVVMYGNNKSVTDVLSHLAQRLFDQAHIVRLSVIKLVGTWLLDLPDRYSFFHKLIPLLLTGFVDETLEVKELTESLWWDIGIKYEKENDDELKDKSSFLDNSNLNSNYPAELQEKRPNLGCRELIRLNASKIVPGILNDTGDWVEATRVKSIQLLYIMIWQAENNITQHLETVLQTLFKSSSENHTIIQVQVAKCAQLVGHFTEPDLSLNIVFKTIRKLSAVNPGAISILTGLLKGHGSKTKFSLIIEALKLLNELSLTVDSQLHLNFIECCESILPINKYEEVKCEEKTEFEYLIFKNIFTISALGNGQIIDDKMKALIQKLISYELLKSNHMKTFITELQADCNSWNDNSLEPIIFAKLINDCGLSEQVINEVISILKTSLDPAKEPQLRTRFLLLIPEIFSSTSTKTSIARELGGGGSNDTNQNKFYLEKCVEQLINEMILPNIIWKAGRSSSAVRMTAIASLALIMQEDSIKTINLKMSTIENLIKMMMSSLDDDNRSTRSYVCKLFLLMLSLFGQKLDKDQLHKLYPEFIKRLDDQSEEIRFEIIKVFNVYINSLNQDYDIILYQAHLQTIYENVLLYLDDPNHEIQLKIFDLLKLSSTIDPEMMLKEVEKVKGKHRNLKYCEDLSQYCQDLIQK